MKNEKHKEKEMKIGSIVDAYFFPPNPEWRIGKTAVIHSIEYYKQFSLKIHLDV